MSSKWNIKNIQKPNKKVVTKTAMTIVLLTGISFNVAFANNNTSSNKINKIYHVYVGDTYIGAVSNEKDIKEAVQAKEQEISNKFTQYEVDGMSNVKILPEQVFSYETEDAETLNKLKEQLVVEAEAYAVQVNGEVIAYVQNKEEFDKAINLLKRQYVSEGALAQAIANQKGNVQTAPNKYGVKVLDVVIPEKMEGKKDKVEPSKILNANQLVNLLKAGTLQKQVYTVKEGDVLGSIAQKHGLKIKDLLALNPSLKNEEALLQIGQKLNVTVEKPLVNVKYTYEKTAEEKIQYKKVVKYDKNLLKGEKKVTQKGVEGKKVAVYAVTEVNGKQVAKNQKSEKIISQAKDEITVVGTKVIPSKGTGEFGWPAHGGYVSSRMGMRWGRMHKGIDIARPSSYGIKASDNGVVVFAGRDGTYGNKVVINHRNGYQTVYAHLSKIQVSVGQTVSKGKQIGIMGSTGRSTGVHLHFEVHKNGALVNPLSVL